ncbi:PD-(D/E)XK nuclease family protein [Priestia aryabhattai]|uniref:PD-(D/E)XK nuclease family protein n=1 Tax=Priestia aryabhattai TaxID=412384 RepID=UPI001C8D8882|nr:PD-(D/E)XK nuclease family protein [Priestia aryabhattai]MBY0062360.1 PD-(D/E)XK nuclease family protein [Priestia aryabhattai]
MNEQEMLQFIEESFEENYELLRLDGGHALAPFVKRMALEQVRLYWRKLKDLAENVSETEVKLTLPLQETPKGRTYTIQGVVDVVKEEEKTTLYDIKTHDVDFVRCNKEDYEGQLNIYAHIWQTIQGQVLDGTSIIATGQTENLRRAYQTKDQKRIENALVEWSPEVPIEFDLEKVKSTIESFGEVIDMIEEHKFSPPPIERLTSPVRENKLFATHVCRNCDIRFSCDSYKEYAFTYMRANRDFLSYYDDYGTEYEKVEILDANLKDEEV